jgi:hypothetical protein
MHLSNIHATDLLLKKRGLKNGRVSKTVAKYDNKYNSAT